MGDLEQGALDSTDRIERLSFFVPGTPIPQGSKKAFVRGKRAVIVDDNQEKLNEWRGVVKNAASQALCGRLGFEKDAELVVLYDFLFMPPKRLTRKRPNVRPDLDKLERAIGDALTDAGVWRDDGQVVVSHTSKEYSETPGVHIIVRELA
jgi:Holliday junction resolvase RusA-like endonuclease